MSELRLIEAESESAGAGLSRIRHACAHILADAVNRHFNEEGEVALGFGGATIDGFYYDFNLPRQFKDDDLSAIEDSMRRIIESSSIFEISAHSLMAAREFFSGQSLKLERLDLLESMDLPEISLCKHGDFIDLCLDKYESSSIDISTCAFKLLSVAGAHQGNGRPMLTRISGTAHKNKEQLFRYLEYLRKTRNKDHRRIGKQLELFHFEKSSSPMPYWLPNGQTIINLIHEFWRFEHQALGFEEISTPLAISHKYENILGEYELEQSACPTVLFNLERRSYRDLPLRMSEFSFVLSRTNQGNANGLLNLRRVNRHDSYIFMSAEQIEAEINSALDLTMRFYGTFQLPHSYRLNIQPRAYIDKSADSKKYEKYLRNSLDNRNIQYAVVECENELSGLGLDILCSDGIGRTWQTGSIKIAHLIPQAKSCKYCGADGNLHTPVMMHNSIYSSIERILAILLEYTGGNLPLWLSPSQALIIPVSKRSLSYALDTEARFKAAGLRCRIAATSKTVSRAIREAESKKVPYMLIVGDIESENNLLSVRKRGSDESISLQREEFLRLALRKVHTRSANL